MPEPELPETSEPELPEAAEHEHDHSHEHGEASGVLKVKGGCGRKCADCMACTRAKVAGE
ncbi:hypothetical protein KA050_01430 [Candidatus Gracilibacteria bacterium]|nr:hypothetical protein [Candidatus Gracilibacteria bacterium]